MKTDNDVERSPQVSEVTDLASPPEVATLDQVTCDLNSDRKTIDAAIHASAFPARVLPSRRNDRSPLRMRTEPPPPGALALTIDETADRLRISRTRVYELLQSKDLKRAKKLSRKTMVTVASIETLERWMVGQLKARETPLSASRKVFGSSTVVPPPDELRAALDAQAKILFPTKRGRRGVGS